MTAEATRVRVARALVLAAALLVLAEVPLVLRMPGLVLVLSVWAAALLMLSRLPARSPLGAGRILGALAAMSLATTVGWFRVAEDERQLIVAFWPHALFSLVHTVLMSGAAAVLLGPRVAAWWARRWARRRDPALGGHRQVAAGLGLWSVSLVTLFPWWLRDVAIAEALPLVPGAAAVGFLLMLRPSRWQVGLAGLVAWTAGTVVLLSFVAPIGYGTVGIYLLMSGRGVLVLVAAITGTTMLFVGRGAMRAALAAVPPPERLPGATLPSEARNP